MSVECFFLEPAQVARIYLRRYAPGTACPGAHGYHDAKVSIEDVQIVSPSGLPPTIDAWPRDDPRWPRACECGYLFQESDRAQRFVRSVYRRQDTGELMTLADAPAGAMWYCDWHLERGPDGHALAVRLPNGCDWYVDSRASNCSRPDDDLHRCWVRHGTPPCITVDKRGNTCSAGAGSIEMTNGRGVRYHGFLRGGVLT